MSSGLVSGIISGPSATLASGPIYNADLSRTRAGLSKGPNVGKRNMEAGWAQTWPAPGATLDLDFVNDRGFVKGFGQGRSMDALTYTRASDANYINANGVLSKAFYTVPPTPYVQTTSSTAVTNFETYSENFTNAAWTKNGLTVANNAVTPPTGFAAAQRITENSGAITLSAMYNRQNDAGQYPYNQVFSVFAKEDPTSAKRYLVLGMYYTGLSRWGWAVVDLAGRQYKTYTDAIQDSVVGASFTDAGNGWVRVSVAINSPLAAQYFSIGMIDKIVATNSYNLGGYTGDGTSGMFVTGAQLESPIINPYAQPRFDWSSTTQLPQNLLTYSRPANVSVWTTATSDFGTTTNVTYGTSTGVDGTLGGATFVDATSFLARSLGTLVANNYVSLFYKSVSLANATIAFRNPSAGGTTTFTYNPSLNTFVISGGTSAINPVITAASNGFVRLSFMNVSNGANMQIKIGTGGANDVIDGLQLDQTSLTSYKATGAYLPINTPLVAASTCNGLMVEESRTNLALWCRDVTQSVWVKTNITTALNQIGIDGLTNDASSLTATSNGATCIQSFTATSATKTSSFYLKAITVTGAIQITLDGTTWSTVDLSNGLWNRVYISGTLANPVIGILIANSGDSVAMDFAQHEANGYPTSPIYTTSATVTRSQDSITLPSQYFLEAYNQSGGSWTMQGYTWGQAGANQNLISLSGAANSIKLTGSGSGGYIRTFSNSFDINGNYNITSSMFSFKHCVSYRNGFFSSAANGVYYNNTNINYEVFGPNLQYMSQMNMGTSAQSAFIRSVTYTPIVYNSRILRDLSNL